LWYALLLASRQLSGYIVLRGRQLNKDFEEVERANNSCWEVPNIGVSVHISGK
jgi:hypothetical protein